MWRFLNTRASCIAVELCCALIATSVALFNPLIKAQSPQLHPRTREQREQAFLAAHHAILNVKVTDASGNPVMGLTPEDFTLIDNEQPRALASLRFVAHGSPVASPRVVLLLDVLNQSTREFAADVAGIRGYLSRVSGQLDTPIAVAVLSGFGLNIGEASRDRGEVLHQLDVMTRDMEAVRCEDLSAAPALDSATWNNRSTVQRAPEQAPNCMNDKFILSVTSLEHLALKEVDTPGRVILIWIGPGWPWLDGKQFMPDTPQIKENFFEHLALVTTAMREGQVTLDAVLSLNRRRAAKEREALPDGVANAEEMTSVSLSMTALVQQSGGQTQDESDGIPNAIAECMRDAEFFYVLAFDFPASPTPHQLHLLRIMVNRAGANVRTNTVYYAEP
jgi:VWFA-related protein